MSVRTTAAGEVTLAYERFGDEGDPLVLLVMGLGTQMLAWQDDLVEMLVARGLQVVRFDNRDCGLSTHLPDAPAPDLQAALMGDTSSAAYSLEHMADDTAALLDALEVPAAHVVGASMGGMIAQEMTLRHPDRVLSLTSIMSTTSPRTGPPTPEAAAVLMQAPATDREGAVQSAVRSYRVIGSPGFPFDEEGVRARAGESYDRAYDPAGTARQLVAIQAGGDRSGRLPAVAVPTLVVHGLSDPLVQPEGGRATADAVPGARLELVEGMGHDLPRDLWPRLVGWIAETVREGEQRR